ncbi:MULTISPECIES: hypothetical protein [Fusobacterium]|uniref:Uncharacterized protein n=1 Tax=Fusobacterium ulcerans TaxID=861 RepID=A0AAX2JBS4_9FUSO|nr:MULTISPECIES: hypothetical protein [Fusobacterium]AVQ29090.1 hypothetical protein C4N20_13675 [Fusobacterium ulcerans]EFS26558.1 hypothetical protein FUAG_02073 [Fusobacterium ulcerans ATCC 49185]MDH6457762.1 hypothetical protein [Fusobacterium sp. PH5-7]MEE0138518.1 hypothetical protein [Fusobacterium ulcerans]SQJ02357.1 Uncharacterised protein [Fusobacterium ulcerans]
MVTIENRIPIFRRGNILDKEVLDNMKETPYEYYSLSYNEYSNGVICGIETYAEDEFLYITAGIIKYNNFYYKIKEKLKIEIPIEDGDYILKVKFLPPVEVEKGKYEKYSIEIFFSIDGKCQNNEMELVRIKRREGAEIRNPSAFVGIDKEYNIVNEIHKFKSTASGVSFPSKLLKIYAGRIFDEKEMESLDEVFCSTALNGSVSRELLNAYIKRRIREECHQADNQKIYEYLKQIYNSMKGNRFVRGSNVKKKNLMMVE